MPHRKSARKPRTAKLKAVEDNKESWEAKHARIGATLDLIDLDDHERAYLAVCQQIHRRYTGDNTPFEAFMDSIVLRVSYGSWPTPNDVAVFLETFREHYDDMKADVRKFVATYPETLAPED